MKDLVHWVRNQSDRVASWACIGLGVICLIAGWVGVSATAFPGEQMPYVVSGGLVGIFLLGLGGVLWLSADLRDEWRSWPASSGPSSSPAGPSPRRRRDEPEAPGPE